MLKTRIVNIINIYLQLADIANIIFPDVSTAIIIKICLVKNFIFRSRNSYMLPAKLSSIFEQMKTFRPREACAFAAPSFSAWLLNKNQLCKVIICRQS